MWSNLVAKLLPAETRGRSFGHLFLAGGITGVIGSAAASKFIEWQGFPNGFGTGFLVCSVICAGSVSCFFFLREPPHPEPVVQQGLRDFLKGIRQDVLGQRNYRFYLLSQVLAGLGAMAVPFFAVVARNQFTLDVKVGATFTAIVLLGRIIGCPLAGLIGDRHGFRVVAFFPPLLLLVATGLALAVSHAGVFYLIFALVGLARAIDSVAMINLPIEFSPHADKTSFLAVRGTVVSPVQALAPLLGGFLVDAFRGSYVLPFALAIVFNAVCIGVLSLLVHEPRRTARP
jgi:MFS family permease